MRTTKGAARNQAKKRLFKRAKVTEAGAASCCGRSKRRWCERARMPTATGGFASVISANCGSSASTRRCANTVALQRIHRRAEAGRYRFGPAHPGRDGGRRSGGIRCGGRSGRWQPGQGGIGGLTMALAEFLQQNWTTWRHPPSRRSVQPLRDDADSLGERPDVEYLGAKQGRLKAVQKQMGRVDSGDRRSAGMRFNEVKQRVESAFQAATERLASGGSRVNAGRISIRPCRARRCGWAGCIRSRRRSKN
jgi:hypothetical protein